MVMRFLFVLFPLIIMAGALGAPATAHEYIRIVQEDGVWWFQDGSGQKFFSVGVNCVGGCYGHAEETPLAPSRKIWIVSALREWGFNTAASWSSPSVWSELYVADQIYTDFVENQHDVFDESFWDGWFADRLREEVKPFLGMKNFIGYFLDNEPEWNAHRIFEFYVGLARNTPGSRAFVSYLKSYYEGSIGKLNRQWGTSYRSFAKIPGTAPPKPYALAMKQGILKSWRTEVAATYYRRYAAMIRALDPHHLILGIRHQGVPEVEFLRALSPYFDVNSINDYNRYGYLRPAYAELYKATGKPMMLTEFSFSGFPHPGHKSLLFVDVYTQENRGIGYQKYVLQAARAPFMVGTHWFMWMDYTRHDPTIRDYWPDENVGLASSDGTVVYAELAKWVTRANTQVAAAHREARQVDPPRHAPQRRSLQRFTPTIDGHISEWPKALAIKPIMTNSLLDHVRADHTYFIAWDQQYLYLAGDIADSRLDHPDQDWAWEGDYLSIHLNALQASNRGSESSSALFIYPHGGGSDGQQPYASRRDGSQGNRQIAIRVMKRLRPGGYTIEARVPATAVWGFKGKVGTSWHIKLLYQNVNEIYLTQWEGVVTLRHASDHLR
jgi:hypothetical protein